MRGKKSQEKGNKKREEFKKKKIDALTCDMWKFCGSLWQAGEVCFCGELTRVIIGRQSGSGAGMCA